MDWKKNPDGDVIPGETWINIAKHRNGKTDIVKVKANLEYQRFEDMPQMNSFEISDNFSLADPKAGIKSTYGEGPKLSVHEGYEKRNSKVDEYKIDEDEFSKPGEDDEDVPF